MATNILTPEQQAIAAATPFLDYQRTPAYRDEVIADNNRVAQLLGAQGEKGWEKGTFGLPVPEPVTPAILAPEPTTAPPIVNTAIPETPIAIEPSSGRALTPCDLGMCEGRISMGNRGSGYNDSSIYTNGTSTLVTGPGQGGYSRLAELATAGFLASRGMTPQQVEAQNRGQEVEQFTNLQRSPVWQSAYQDAFARTRSPQAAAAEANWAAAQSDPSRAGIYYRTQQPLDNAAVNDAIDAATTRAQITGDYSPGQALSQNPVASAPAVTGVTQNADGTFSIAGSAGGRDFNTQAQDLNSFLFGTSADTPAQLWQLQQYQQQQGLAKQKADQLAAQQNFENQVSLFNSTVKASPTEKPITAYQQAQLDNQGRRLDLYEQNNAQRAATAEAKAAAKNGTAAPAANTPVIINGVSIAAPSTFTPPARSTPTGTPAAQKQTAAPQQRTSATPIPKASANVALPKSTKRSVEEINGLLASTNLRIQELARRPQGSLPPSEQKNLQTLVDNVAWYQKELELARAAPPSVGVNIARPGTAPSFANNMQQAQWLNNLSRPPQ